MTSQLRRKRQITAASPLTNTEQRIVRLSGRSLTIGLVSLCFAFASAFAVQAEQAGYNGSRRNAYSVGHNGAKLKWLPARASRTPVRTQLAQHTEPLTKESRPAVPRLREALLGSGPSNTAAETSKQPAELGSGSRYQLAPPNGLVPSRELGPKPTSRVPSMSPPASSSFNALRTGRQPANARSIPPTPPTVPTTDRVPSAASPVPPQNVLEIEEEEKVEPSLPAPELQRPKALSEDRWGDDTRRGKPLESYLDMVEQDQHLAGEADDCKPPRDVPIDEILDMLEPPKGRGDKGNIYPPNCPMKHETFQPRQWACLTYTWKASGLCHKPLYFEDVQLERYGHSWGPYLQPIISGGHFFLNVPILPYKMGLEPPCECMYTLGYYRPGSCAPYMLDPIPLSVRAALFEAGVWTGMSYVIP